MTAIGVAALRALYTRMPAPLGFVRDPFAARLLPRPLGALTAAVRGRPAVASVVHHALRLATRELSLSSPLRTLAIDETLRDSITAGARQLVLLGSGLDARGWRCAELSSVTVFEVDRPRTLAYKRRRMAGVQSKAARHVYVPTDFARDDLARVLKEAGFQPEIPTVWLWEGVIIYLHRDAIASTIRSVAELSASGSRLIATYTCPGLGIARGPTLHLRLGARLIGEAVHGEISTRALHALLESHGLVADHDNPVNAWASHVVPLADRMSGPQWERLLVASKR